MITATEPTADILPCMDLGGGNGNGGGGSSLPDSDELPYWLVTLLDEVGAAVQE